MSINTSCWCVGMGVLTCVLSVEATGEHQALLYVLCNLGSAWLQVRF